MVGLLLSVALLWWALRGVDATELLRHLREANPWLLAAAVAVATGTFVLKAIRWRVLLLPAHAESSFNSRFSAVCIGGMANNLLPARLGEFARVLSFNRMEPVPISATLASLIVERLFDALILMIFLIPALSLPGFGAYGSPLIRNTFIAAAVVVTAGLLVMGLLVRFPSWFLRWTERLLPRLFPERAAEKVLGMVVSFIAGLGALRHTHVLMRVVAWSLVIWLWNSASFWLGFLAFDIEAPGFAGAMLLQSIVGFAVSIPSSPGFFGPFEAGARVALGIWEIDPSRTISFAASYHILSFIPVTLLGLWFAHRLGISLSETRHSEEFVEAAAEGNDVWETSPDGDPDSAGGPESAPPSETARR